MGNRLLNELLYESLRVILEHDEVCSLHFASNLQNDILNFLEGFDIIVKLSLGIQNILPCLHRL